MLLIKKYIILFEIVEYRNYLSNENLFMEDKIMLGERLQYLRLEKGMTQKELSKVFKVSLKTIQFYEQNRTIPDIYLVAEMAKFFNVSCDYILGVVNTPIPLDEREAEAKDHIYMPKEFMKNKETRRTYKTIVEYVKMVHEMK
ncbi:XRE family transcriptional regulator [Coprobacillus sp. AF17-11AC]|nr:XRE family transcriptional regulator [Coprobacillus sp. AF17-17AC]RGG81459.1 XRE family transcriptional regulator [Coprobacillus sp. AF17-11AC]